MSARNLIMTGAWNPVIPSAPDALAQRRERLLGSLDHYASLAIFDRIVLADATLTDADRERLSARLPQLELPVLRTSPQGDHSGPSYLEALLYRELVRARTIEDDGSSWVKVTGGYRVLNLQAILSVYEQHAARGLAFLHQHPLRVRPRYAMSAFYVLDAAAMGRFFDVVADALERTRTAPLEGFLLDFFRASHARTVRAPYPRLDAYFATSNLHSDSPRLRAHFLAWRLLSALGVYALALTGPSRDV